jgi:hypothetical protein
VPRRQVQTDADHDDGAEDAEEGETPDGAHARRLAALAGTKHAARVTCLLGGPQRAVLFEELRATRLCRDKIVVQQPELAHRDAQLGLQNISPFAFDEREVFVVHGFSRAGESSIAL